MIFGIGAPATRQFSIISLPSKTVIFFGGTSMIGVEPEKIHKMKPEFKENNAHRLFHLLLTFSQYVMESIPASLEATHWNIPVSSTRKFFITSVLPSSI